MSDIARCVLSEIKTLDDMIVAFGNEQHCRSLLEEMIWPNGRICPACGYKYSVKIAGRDMGRRRARPGLYRCSKLPIPVYRDDTYPSSFHQAASEHMAQGALVNSAI
jgi:hypothetical protein